MESTISQEVSHFVCHLKNKIKVFRDDGIPMEHAFYAPIINTLWYMTGSTRFEYDDPLLLNILHLLADYEKKITDSGAILNAFPSLRHVAPEFTAYNAALRFSNSFSSYMKVRDLHTMN